MNVALYARYAAIRQGIITASTKEALEQAEAERAHLRQMVQGPYKKLDKVASFLPDMVGKFKALVAVPGG